MNVFQWIFYVARAMFMSHRALQMENRALRRRAAALRETPVQSHDIYGSYKIAQRLQQHEHLELGCSLWVAS